MSFYERLVYARRHPVFGRLAYWLLKLLGAEIPPSVEIGPVFYCITAGWAWSSTPKQ